MYNEVVMSKALIENLVFGLVFAGLALPLIAEKVKPNLWYGFRVRKTLEHPTIWYLVNRHCGARLLAASLAFLLTSVSLYFLPGIRPQTYHLACMLVFMGFFLIGTLQTVLYLRQLKP